MATDPNTLDLDALEREGRPGPLVVTMRGQSFTMTDPLLLPWKQYEAVDWYDATEALKVLLTAEEYEAFEALDLSQHAINILAAKLADHYFGGSPGESGGSPAS